MMIMLVIKMLMSNMIVAVVEIMMRALIVVTMMTTALHISAVDPGQWY